MSLSALNLPPLQLAANEDLVRLDSATGPLVVTSIEALRNPATHGTVFICRATAMSESGVPKTDAQGQVISYETRYNAAAQKVATMGMAAIRLQLTRALLGEPVIARGQLGSLDLSDELLHDCSIRAALAAAAVSGSGSALGAALFNAL